MKSFCRNLIFLICVAAMLAILSQNGIAQEFRTWNDASGKFTIKAKLLDKTETHVQLETEFGKKISVEIEKLGKADQEFLGVVGSGDVAKPIGVVKADLSGEKELSLDGEFQFLREFDSETSVAPRFSPMKHDLRLPRDFTPFLNRKRTRVIPVQQSGGTSIGSFCFDLSEQKAAKIAGFNLSGSVSDLSPSGQHLVCVDLRNRIRSIGIFSIGNRSLKLATGWTMPCPLHSAGWFPPKFLGATKLVEQEVLSSVIRVWDWTKARSVWKVTASPGCQPGISANGKQVAFHANGAIFVVDSSTGKQLARIKCLHRSAQKIEFSPNGKKVAMLGGGLVRVIELAQPSQIVEFMSPLELNLSKRTHRNATSDELFAPFFWLDNDHLQLGSFTIASQNGEIRNIPFLAKIGSGTHLSGVFPLGGGRIGGLFTANKMLGIASEDAPPVQASSSVPFLQAGDTVRLEVVTKGVPDDTKEAIANYVTQQLKEASIGLDKTSAKLLVVRAAFPPEGYSSGTAISFASIRGKKVRLPAIVDYGKTRFTAKEGFHLVLGESGFYIDGIFHGGVKYKPLRHIKDRNGLTHESWIERITVAAGLPNNFQFKIDGADENLIEPEVFNLAGVDPSLLSQKERERLEKARNLNNR